jgi:hypothetical protein
VTCPICRSSLRDVDINSWQGATVCDGAWCTWFVVWNKGSGEMIEPDPPAPKGVRITGLGLDLNVDDFVSYQGLDKQGCYLWTFPVTVAWYELIQEGRMHVRIATLPSMTVVNAVPAPLPRKAA